MIFRTVVRDCLYLNWAIPREALPSPPSALRYQVHSWEGSDIVFGSALLFRQERMRFATLPMFRFSYPQCNLRLNTIDDEGVPSILYVRMVVPAWIVPGARLVGNQPATAGSLDFPATVVEEEEARWVWRVRQSGELRVSARVGSPQTAHGPTLGGWQETVAYFRLRPRGYIESSGSVRRVETTHETVAVWPVSAQVEETRLLQESFPLTADQARFDLHSAFICPETPLTLELADVPHSTIPRHVPAPG